MTWAERRTEEKINRLGGRWPPVLLGVFFQKILTGTNQRGIMDLLVKEILSTAAKNAEKRVL